MNKRPDTVGELQSRSQIAISKLSYNKMQELGIISVNPETIALILPETVRVAKVAFPKGNPYLTFRDVLGVIFSDADFVHL